MSARTGRNIEDDGTCSLCGDDLQFGRQRVTARTAYRVQRVHRELTT